MHAAGFYHEQSRTDRDTYVFVNYTNVQPGIYYKFFFSLQSWDLCMIICYIYSTGYENNFVSYDENTITSLGEPYDWGN